VRIAAIQALGTLDPAEVSGSIPKLIACFQSAPRDDWPDFGIRGAVIDALGRIGEGSPVVAGFLAGRATSGPSRERQWTLRALRRLRSHDTGVLAALRQSLADEDPHIRFEAAMALAAVHAGDARQVAAVLLDIVERAYRETREITITRSHDGWTRVSRVSHPGRDFVFYWEGDEVEVIRVLKDLAARDGVVQEQYLLPAVRAMLRSPEVDDALRAVERLGPLARELLDELVRARRRAILDDDFRTRRRIDRIRAVWRF
jgi:hypothetical protein